MNPTDHSPLTVFRAVTRAYGESGGRSVTNDELYSQVAKMVGVPVEEFKKRAPVGKKRVLHAPMTRTARFVQQTLKARRLLEKVDGARGVWRLTEEGKQKLHRIERGRCLVAFSTRLGCALWCDARDWPAGLDEPISLVFTSPPYPLLKLQSRAYGNPDRAGYTDFIVSAMEPLVKRLRRGGLLALNLPNDCFEPGSPARSLYLERLIIALHDKLGLSLMERGIWHDESKAPGPIQWCSLTRQQLAGKFEFVVCFSNDARAAKSKVDRVLVPHSERHLKLIAAGGERREQVFADGAHRVRVGSYGKPTAGRIPGNVLAIGHRCVSQSQYKAAARALGLSSHGAAFPAKLARFFVEFMTEKGDLVVDPFAGSMTTGLVCEELERYWIGLDVMADYLRGGAERFREREGLWINPDIDRVLGLQASDPQLDLLARRAA